VPGAVDLAAHRILLLVDLLVLCGSEFAAIGRAFGVDLVIDGRFSLFEPRRLPAVSLTEAMPLAEFL